MFLLDYIGTTSALFMTLDAINITRELFISLDAIYIILYIEIVGVFLYRAYKNKRGRVINLAWSVAFALFGLLGVLSLVQDYYFGQANIFLGLYRIIPIVAIFGLMEYFLQKYKKTRFFFTIFTLVAGMIFNFAVWPVSDIALMLGLISWVVFALVFFRVLIKLSTGTVRLNVILFAISFILVMGGSVILSPRRTDLFSNLLIVELIVRLVQMPSFFLMVAVLSRLPIFFEVNWRENLTEIHIIHSIGTAIASFKFKERKERISEVLVAGGMFGISALLKEISGSSEELKVIDHGDQKIMLVHGNKFTLALNVQTEMQIYWDKLIQLREIIEKYFGDILDDWDGNLVYFKPLNNIIPSIFV